jgi:hypothetical protein
VIRLDRVITDLLDREQRNRRAHAELVDQLTATRERRDTLAARVRAAAPTRRTVPAVTAPPAAPPGEPDTPPWTPGGAAPAGVATARPEASIRGIQILLFVVGGVLLGIGAVVFAVVAWTTFGVVGQAAILAAVTVLALAVPAVALWRRLRGTAETVATLGLLLVLLDGYAAWSAGLLERTGLAGATWAGIVCAAGALVALGYGRATGLAGPRFAALVLAQPVLPVLASEPVQGLAGTADRLTASGLALVAVAAADLGVGWRLTRTAGAPPGSPAPTVPIGARPALRVVAWVATGLALALAVVEVGIALVVADRPGEAAVAGAVLVAAAVVLTGVGRVATGWRIPAAAVAVLAAAVSAGRVVVLAWPDHALVAAAAIVAAAGLGAAAAARLDRAGAAGYRVGGLVAAGVTGGLVVPVVLAQAVTVAARAPARVSALDGWLDWQLPVALLLVAVALVGLVPGGRWEVAAGGLALLALAVPPALGWPWWAPAAADLVVVAVLGLAAAQAATTRRTVVSAAAAAALVTHALVVGLAAPAAAAAVLGGIVLLGTAVAVRARQAGLAGPPAARAVVARVALASGLLAWPGAVAATVAAAGAAEPWPGRAAFLAAGSLLAVVAIVRRVEPGYLAAAAVAAHVVTPVAIVAGLAEGGDAIGPYGAGAVVVLATAGLLRPPVRRHWWLLLRMPAIVAALVVAAPPVAAVLAGPYSWLGGTWTGAPSGVGLLTGDGWPEAGAGALTLVLLTVAAGLAGRVLAGRWTAGAAAAALVAPVAVLVGLAELGAPWPVVPAVSLLLGLAGVLAAGRGIGAAATRGAAAVVVAGYGLALAGAGLAGSLPTRWSTLVALGTALVVAAVVGAAGRVPAGRVAGWVGAVAVAILLAVASVLAAGGGLPVAGFAVLGVCGLALALGSVPRTRPADRVALEAAAHAGAAVALLLSLPSLGRAALVAALWGVALGVRALRPGEPASGRAGRAVAATGCELLAWWLLLAYGQVVAVEAYTLPAALGALVAGTVASRRGVGSWVAYGPALAAAALPSLFLAVVDPLPLRRLLLGGIAVAVVVAGARLRLQAPVVVGGAVAILVAVRELGLVWQLLDTWIPLTVSGLVLVALAATYERRRRDLARLRAAVGRMT